MKKTNFILFTFISIFFIHTSVNASTFKANIDLTTVNANEINLFYEFSNSTPLANFLIENQFALFDNLKSICTGYYCDKVDNSSNYSIGIYDYNDSSFSSPISVDSAKYVFVLLYSPKISITTDSYSIIDESSSCTVFLYYFDKNLNFLSYYEDQDFYYTKSIKNNDLTSFFSSFYIFNNKYKFSNLSFDKYILNAVYIDGKKYTIEDNENYNSFTSWISDIFSTAYDDEKFSFNFDSYRKSPILGKNYKYISLADVLFFGSTLTVPEGWSKINITDYEYGYYLIPIKEDISDICPSKQNCTDLAFMVSKTNTKQNILLGSFDYSTGQAVYKGNYTFYQNTVATYKLFTIFDGALVDDSSLTMSQYPNYIYQFYTDYTFSDAFVFYNPIYYSVIPADVGSGSDGTINVNGNRIYVGSSSSTANDIYKGAAADIGYNGDLSNLGEYIKNEGISIDNIKNNINFENITSNAVSNLSSFISSLSSIGSTVSTFLDSMPSEITNVLMFCFTISVAIIVIKIIL